MSKKRRVVLLIIDGQQDFVLPTGALPVKGAVKDMDNVVAFIKRNMKELDAISCTLDSHRTIDISHTSWWKDKDGNNVKPFTSITSKDLEEGKYTPQFAPAWSYEYVKKLETQGEFTHFIWPNHCLIATTGHALYIPLSEAVNAWEKESGIPVKYVTKGDNPYTEHFGAFRANIEMQKDPGTQFNQELVKYLEEYDDVLLAGEAKSHCVANTLKQLVNEVPQLASKVTIMEDCMSDVDGLPQIVYDIEKGIYDDAKAKGVKFAKSTEIDLGVPVNSL